MAAAAAAAAAMLIVSSAITGSTTTTGTTASTATTDPHVIGSSSMLSSPSTQLLLALMVVTLLVLILLGVFLVQKRRQSRGLPDRAGAEANADGATRRRSLIAIAHAVTRTSSNRRSVPLLPVPPTLQCSAPQYASIDEKAPFCCTAAPPQYAIPPVYSSSKLPRRVNTDSLDPESGASNESKLSRRSSLEFQIRAHPQLHALVCSLDVYNEGVLTSVNYAESNVESHEYEYDESPKAVGPEYDAQAPRQINNQPLHSPLSICGAREFVREPSVSQKYDKVFDHRLQVDLAHNQRPRSSLC